MPPHRLSSVPLAYLIPTEGRHIRGDSLWESPTENTNIQGQPPATVAGRTTHEGPSSRSPCKSGHLCLSIGNERPKSKTMIHGLEIQDDPQQRSTHQSLTRHFSVPHRRHLSAVHRGHGGILHDTGSLESFSRLFSTRNAARPYRGDRSGAVLCSVSLTPSDRRTLVALLERRARETFGPPSVRFANPQPRPPLKKQRQELIFI